MLTAIVLIVLEIARILLKRILEQINEMLVEEYCGKRYERGKMQRNGYNPAWRGNSESEEGEKEFLYTTSLNSRAKEGISHKSDFG